MDLPDLPPERADVQRAAYERMQSGTTLMLEGLDQLLRAASTDDATAMQDAVAKVREGSPALTAACSAPCRRGPRCAPTGIAVVQDADASAAPPAPVESEQARGACRGRICS